RCFVGGKHVHHLNKRQTFSIGFSSHDKSPFADDFYTGMDFYLSSRAGNSQFYQAEEENFQP
ncbi:MAG: hypothetical protein OXC63_04265, partial [Aestuariivita sp.]|nr:hypothetical protein [Aestuariivita sp.]